jgi:hypothetical protein
MNVGERKKLYYSIDHENRQPNKIQMKLIYQLAIYFISNDSQLILIQFYSTDKKFLLFKLLLSFNRVSSIIP